MPLICNIQSWKLTCIIFIFFHRHMIYCVVTNHRETFLNWDMMPCIYYCLNNKPSWGKMQATIYNCISLLKQFACHNDCARLWTSEMRLVYLTILFTYVTCFAGWDDRVLLLSRKKVGDVVVLLWLPWTYQGVPGWEDLALKIGRNNWMRNLAPLRNFGFISVFCSLPCVRFVCQTYTLCV